MDALGAGAEDTGTGMGGLVACIETLDTAVEELAVTGKAGAVMIAGLARRSTSPICWSTSWLEPPGVWKKSRRVFLVGLASDMLSGELRDRFFPPKGVLLVGSGYGIKPDLPDISPAVAAPLVATGMPALGAEAAGSSCGAAGSADMSSPVDSTWRRA